MRKNSKLAFGIAKDVHQNGFSIRRGSFEVDCGGMVVIYNNNPYSSDASLRDKETARFRAKLSAAGMRESSYATYPETGPDAGYTFAMVVMCEKGQEGRVVDLYKEATKETFDSF